jgi:hypothetical protein
VGVLRGGGTEFGRHNVTVTASSRIRSQAATARANCQPTLSSPRWRPCAARPRSWPCQRLSRSGCVSAIDSIARVARGPVVDRRAQPPRSWWAATSHLPGGSEPVRVRVHAYPQAGQPKALSGQLSTTRWDILRALSGRDQPRPVGRLRDDASQRVAPRDRPSAAISPR